MFRVDLEVPFADNAEAQRRGARWDSARRVWFVPENRDASAFARWLAPAQPPNVRGHEFLIASATLACWRCRTVSPIHGFALPAGHETLEVDDESGEERWDSSEYPSLVCYLDFVVPEAIETMRRLTQFYRYSYRRRTQTFYWANLCEGCGAKLGDYDAFCEPGQGFMPLTRCEAEDIRLTPIAAPFAASAGGWSLGVDLFEYMSFDD